MAKPKLTTSLNGTVIGTRATDRHYTHVVACVAMDEAGMRQYAAREPSEVAHANNLFRAELALELQHMSAGQERDICEGMSVKTTQDELDHARALIEAAGAATIEALVLELRRRDEAHCIAFNLRCFGKPAVLSWHHSAELAQRALATLADREHHRFLTFAVLPVDATVPAAA